MRYLIFLLFCSASLFAQDESTASDFFQYSYDDSNGKVYLDVQHLDKEFIYVNYLAAGVGSNDLGLDRGKINNTRLVKFIKKGNKLLLLQPNMDYRAISDNANEVKAVEEAFAKSILWGFDIIKKNGTSYQIDLTPFLLQDANGIAKSLKRSKQGSYKLDKKRSVVSGENLLAFPRNVEFESMLTFTGEASGRYIRSVTPSSDAVTIVQHQSFVALPDDGYTPRAYHPYSGYFNINFFDYATAIEDPLEQRYIRRHRLQKKSPGNGLSEAIEPIIYYVDAGCPEPVKSALIEGASWWNQAYEAAGFRNAFQVKELPEGAHPLDVRYNVIQWVHRSTRGWSYGASVVDPRTGEIIKGHVSLGSLRVRQDFMIAQGILSSYTGNNADHTMMKQLALARLRQLSAHEVGHTIGLAHNFAASTNNRASVMDYPHPYIQLKDGKIDISDAYDDNIGDWDKRAIVYGYTEFANRSEDENGLLEILQATKAMNLDYMSDPDSRSQGSAHPRAHLWDNGIDPIAELERIMTLRTYSLDQFGENSIVANTPYSELEKVVVPVYLMHRYQVEAVSKLIGGVDYNYAVKGQTNLVNEIVPIKRQQAASRALLKTLSPEALSYPKSVLEAIPPSAYGYGRSRESFDSNMDMVFDPMVSAEAYSNFVFRLLLNPDRLARVQQQSDLGEFLGNLKEKLFKEEKRSKEHDQLRMIVQKAFVINMLKVSMDANADKQVKAMVDFHLPVYIKKSKINDDKVEWEAHYAYLSNLTSMRNKPEKMAKIPELAAMPPGSPIGCH